MRILVSESKATCVWRDTETKIESRGLSLRHSAPVPNTPTLYNLSTIANKLSFFP